jgi:hypothetical protein
MDEPLPTEDDESRSEKRAEGGDAADAVPVPPEMSPAEIDERARVVEKIRDDELSP